MRHVVGSAKFQAPTIRQGTNPSFGPLQQIDAGVLNVGYAEAGPADGRAVILLHGWPYDIHSYLEVAPLLAWKGYRVIVPYLRGYGTTRFLSSETLRNGQQSALALDVIALLDALKIEQAIVAGCDWGARTADIRRRGSRSVWAEFAETLIRPHRDRRVDPHRPQRRRQRRRECHGQQEHARRAQHQRIARSHPNTPFPRPRGSGTPRRGRRRCRSARSAGTCAT